MSVKWMNYGHLSIKKTFCENDLEHEYGKYLINTFGKGIVLVDKNKKTSSFVKVVNDYYGNIEIPVNVGTFRNGWFVWNMEPADLIDAIEARLKENNCTDKDKEVLKKLLPTLNANANNVMFMGKLK